MTVAMRGQGPNALGADSANEAYGQTTGFIDLPHWVAALCIAAVASGVVLAVLLGGDRRTTHGLETR